MTEAGDGEAGDGSSSSAMAGYIDRAGGGTTCCTPAPSQPPPSNRDLLTSKGGAALCCSSQAAAASASRCSCADNDDGCPRWGLAPFQAAAKSAPCPWSGVIHECSVLCSAVTQESGASAAWTAQSWPQYRTARKMRRWRSALNPKQTVYPLAPASCCRTRSPGSSSLDGGTASRLGERSRTQDSCSQGRIDSACHQSVRAPMESWMLAMGAGTRSSDGCNVHPTGRESLAP
eukprot:CAMPEP_0174734972 /NCGR_PEP_ID=MMETSP1094-20130205/64165_1 /TAXON_ID=156173 /ORGANISM="Chrysochromulina brevifilum, Strain UTEX LB 985" /LENGTH=231 /DNA_ID=CAMNT_0015937873 /DNA_START=381 /DNA_END=1077 /DNA_ORIENTATION=+